MYKEYSIHVPSLADMTWLHLGLQAMIFKALSWARMLNLTVPFNSSSKTRNPPWVPANRRLSPSRLTSLSICRCLLSWRASRVTPNHLSVAINSSISSYWIKHGYWSLKFGSIRCAWFTYLIHGSFIECKTCEWTYIWMAVASNHASIVLWTIIKCSMHCMLCVIAVCSYQVLHCKSSR